MFEPVKVPPERCRDRAAGSERDYLEQQLKALSADAEKKPRLDPEARAGYVEAIRERVAKYRKRDADPDRRPK